MNYNGLKNEIKNRKLSFKECAEKVGMTEVGFHKTLSKETMTIATYEKVCDLLGMSPCSFFDDAGSISIAGNQNQVGNRNRLVLASGEAKALRQRIKDLEALLVSKDEIIAAYKTQIEFLTPKYK